jgi:hypothetical protein
LQSSSDKVQKGSSVSERAPSLKEGRIKNKNWIFVGPRLYQMAKVKESILDRFFERVSCYSKCNSNSSEFRTDFNLDRAFIMKDHKDFLHAV